MFQQIASVPDATGPATLLGTLFQFGENFLSNFIFERFLFLF
jgi:hypothetical protein